MIPGDPDGCLSEPIEDRPLRPMELARFDEVSWCDEYVEGCGEDDLNAGFIALANCATE